MKVSEIDPNKIDKNIIKKFFYNIKKEEYESADYLVIYGCHLKEVLNEFMLKIKLFNYIIG